MKAKISSYSDEATDLHSRKLPEEGSNYIFWLIILIGSALKKDENYYPQVFLKESKYIVKEKKAIRYINDNLKFSFDGSNESHKEYIKSRHYDEDLLFKKKILYV